MSRHRNVRTMDYSEEYDGFDDVYGHSVEDDYCISPSDAAQFMFDRSTRQPQMSAFFNEENDIAEEDELNLDGTQEGHSRRDSDNYQRSGLNEEDEARMRSCLDEIRNVIGDSIPEQILVDAVLKNDFNFNKALDAVLSNSSAGNTGDAPKPQRERRNRDRDDTVYSSSPQFNPFDHVSNISAHSLRENMAKLEIKDRDHISHRIPPSRTSSVLLGQYLGSLSNSKLCIDNENYMMEEHKLKMLKDACNVPTRQLGVLSSNFGSVDLMPTKYEGSSPSIIHRTGESYNSSSASGKESPIKLNIPKLKLKVRNDSEKENFEDNDCMSSLQSLRPHIERGTAEDNGSLSNLALDHNVPFTTLSQLADRHTLQNPNLSSELGKGVHSQVNSTLSLAQLDHSGKSFCLPSFNGKDKISSLTKLENKQAANTFKLQSMEEDMLNSFKLAKKCSAKSLCSDMESNFSSLTGLSDKLSTQSSEQEISCSPFSSLSQLASIHSHKLNQASPQDANNFSSLTELANRNSNICGVRECKSEKQFLPFTIVTTGQKEESISSLADLASSDLKISGKLSDASLMKKQNFRETHPEYTPDSSNVSANLNSSKHNLESSFMQSHSRDLYSHLTSLSPNALEKERKMEFEFLKAASGGMSHKYYAEPCFVDSDQSCSSKRVLDDSNWVIDLTCALQSPNSRATQSQINLSNVKACTAKTVGSECTVNLKLCESNDFALGYRNDLNVLHQDLTELKESSSFALDYENGLKILHQNLTELKKSSTSFGKIICKKWKPLSIPYINPKKQSLGKVVHFTFTTPSPDDKILILRRK